MLSDRLKRLRDRSGKNQVTVATDLAVSQSTIGNWESGARTPDAQMLIRIADYYNCSLDYLLGRTDNIHGSAAPELTAKEELDIAKELDEILSGMNSDSLMFDGEPLDEETKELLRASLENSLRMAKVIAKQKYTPKKYRKE